MNDNIAFLELKYGTIYGGAQNFFITSEVTLLVFNPYTSALACETLVVNADVDLVFVATQVNDIGHTTGRSKYVMNLQSKKRKPFRDSFKIGKQQIADVLNKLKTSGSPSLRAFINNNLAKHKIGTLVTFDGKRDITLCKKAKAEFGDIIIYDLQRELSRETNYLFSLNKLAIITNYQRQGSRIASNNMEYFLPRHAPHTFNYGTAAFDSTRMFIAYQEYNLHHNDFLLKAAILVNKVMRAKAEQKKVEEAHRIALRAERERREAEQALAAAAQAAEAETLVTQQEEHIETKTPADTTNTKMTVMPTEAELPTEELTADEADQAFPVPPIIESEEEENPFANDEAKNNDEAGHDEHELTITDNNLSHSEQEIAAAQEVLETETQEHQSEQEHLSEEEEDSLPK